MPNYRFSVTEADIAQAVQNDSVRCVLAQAIARTLPDASRIDVDLQTVRFTIDGERFIYLTPYSVQDYVVAFDAGDDIQPFTCVLDERRRVIAQKPQKTEAGAAIQRARTKTQRKQAKAEQLELTAAGQAEPKPTKAERAEAAELLPKAKREARTAKRELADVKAEYAGAKQFERVGEGRLRPPRKARTNERHYGRRELRVNKPKADS